MSISQFILKKKPAAVILCLKDTTQGWYPSKLAAHSGASYVYVAHWLTKLEQAGWVKFEKKGKLKSVLLTDKGVSIANSLDELVKKIQAAKAEAAASAQKVEAASKEEPHQAAQ